MYGYWKSPEESRASGNTMNNLDSTRVASCMDDFDPDSLTVDQALSRIRESVPMLTGIEQVPLRGALWRVTASPTTSPAAVPAHSNSAMDGYAVRAADLPHRGNKTLRLIGTAWAGRPLQARVQTDQCARIMTGAILPDGADTVIMQEDCEAGGGTVTFATGHRAGQFVRAAGEDIAEGATVVPAGKRLSPTELGLLASLGMGEVTVARKPRVAFFSTGDELRSIGESLQVGQIYDSNRYTLHGMLTRLGVDLIDMGVVRDEPGATGEAFSSAAAMADAIITTGGASVGDADYVTDTLRKLGSVNFWKVAMKPGRPLAFGRVGDALFFGLPGNPVSVMVTFYQFVMPALRRLMGEHDVQPVRIKARLQTALQKRPGRLEFQRGYLTADPGQGLSVQSTGEQGSGILNSMSQANCFIVLPLESGDVSADALVDVEPFYGIV